MNINLKLLIIIKQSTTRNTLVAIRKNKSEYHFGLHYSQIIGFVAKYKTCPGLFLHKDSCCIIVFIKNNDRYIKSFTNCYYHVSSTRHLLVNLKQSSFWFNSLVFGVLLPNLKYHLRITTQECFQDPILQGLPG
jgi:hypothetical protein